jgi:hypothetical protein
VGPTPDEIAQERGLRRRVRLLTDMTASCLMQDGSMTLGEAVEMIVALRRAVVEMFPGSGATFDLVVRPRLERILTERWGITFEAAAG